MGSLRIYQINGNLESPGITNFGKEGDTLNTYNTIEDAVSAIRNEPYAKNMREAIARGIELAALTGTGSGSSGQPGLTADQRQCLETMKTKLEALFNECGYRSDDVGDDGYTVQRKLLMEFSGAFEELLGLFEEIEPEPGEPDYLSVVVAGGGTSVYVPSTVASTNVADSSGNSIKDRLTVYLHHNGNQTQVSDSDYTITTLAGGYILTDGMNAGLIIKSGDLTWGGTLTVYRNYVNGISATVTDVGTIGGKIPYSVVGEPVSALKDYLEVSKTYAYPTVSETNRYIVAADYTIDGATVGASMSSCTIHYSSYSTTAYFEISSSSTKTLIVTKTGSGSIIGAAVKYTDAGGESATAGSSFEESVGTPNSYICTYEYDDTGTDYYIEMTAELGYGFTVTSGSSTVNQITESRSFDPDTDSSIEVLLTRMPVAGMAVIVNFPSNPYTVPEGTLPSSLSYNVYRKFMRADELTIDVNHPYTGGSVLALDQGAFSTGTSLYSFTVTVSDEQAEEDDWPWDDSAAFHGVSGFTANTGNMTVIVTSTSTDFDATFTITGSNGTVKLNNETITTGSTKTLTPGTTYTITVTANAGYVLSSATVNETSMNNGSYQFEADSSNDTFDIVFTTAADEPDEFTLMTVTTWATTTTGGNQSTTANHSTKDGLVWKRVPDDMLVDIRNIRFVEDATGTNCYVSESMKFQDLLTRYDGWDTFSTQVGTASSSVKPSSYTGSSISGYEPCEVISFSDKRASTDYYMTQIHLVPASGYETFSNNAVGAGVVGKVYADAQTFATKHPCRGLLSGGGIKYYESITESNEDDVNAFYAANASLDGAEIKRWSVSFKDGFLYRLANEFKDVAGKAAPWKRAVDPGAGDVNWIYSSAKIVILNTSDEQVIMVKYKKVSTGGT